MGNLEGFSHSRGISRHADGCHIYVSYICFLHQPCYHSGTLSGYLVFGGACCWGGISLVMGHRTSRHADGCLLASLASQKWGKYASFMLRKCADSFLEKIGIPTCSMNKFLGFPILSLSLPLNLNEISKMVFGIGKERNRRERASLFTARKLSHISLLST